MVDMRTLGLLGSLKLRGFRDLWLQASEAGSDRTFCVDDGGYKAAGRLLLLYWGGSRE